LLLGIFSYGTNARRAHESLTARNIVRNSSASIDAELEQRMATRDPAPPPKLNLSEQERRTIIQDGLDRHYRGLLDEPIPALGNKSPRAAAKTAKGRAKVVDWLKTLENYTAQMAGHNDEMATYDSSWLWAELGVDELRQ